MKEIEILVELKTEINNAKEIIDKNFDFVGIFDTKDTYFFDPLRDKLKPNEESKIFECCRIREKGDKKFVTYKVDKYEKDIWKYSDEFETEINNAEILEKIFKNIGLEVLIVIENKKYIFENNKYEIVLEEVKNLGNFLEVEYKGKSEDVEDIKKEIFKFIESLGLEIGSELNSGKPELMLKKINF